MKPFDRGTAVYLLFYFRDVDGVLMDPPLAKVSILDPVGSLRVTEDDLTKISTGKYFYIWQSELVDLVGQYTAVTRAENVYRERDKEIVFELE